MRLIITGAAGFIGFHLAKALLEQGHTVHGFDSVNDYYDPSFKEARLAILRDFQSFSFTKGFLEDNEALSSVWKEFDPDHVVHLAAQAGVRYSLENPNSYIQSNIIGFQNIIELVRSSRLSHFVYASSSSVYGGITEYPLSEAQKTDQPVSLYAATKLSNELVAKAYSHLYDIPSTGLRFFTVYGPYGRPDMAMFKFTRLILAGEPIPVFNHGNMVRDFTFIDDIIQGVMASISLPEKGQVYNLGRGKPEQLMDMIHIIEASLGKKAEYNMMPMQAGDVPETVADISKARKNLGYNPATTIKEGIPQFAAWYNTLGH